MDGAATWYGRVNEDGSFSLLARVCALEGSGEEVVPGEGPVIQQGDLTDITCKIFSLGTNRDNLTGTEITPAPGVVIANNIYDVLQTAGWPVVQDSFGYNFRMDIAPTYVPNPEEWYLIEAEFILAGGGVVWFRTKVKTVALRTS